MTKPVRTTSQWRPGAYFDIWTRSTRTAASRGFTILVDQAVASGTNFFTTLVIGRACLPEELGMYVLGCSVAIMSLRIPKALIWTPYTAFTPSMTDEDRRLYSGSALAQLSLFAAVSAVLVLGAGLGMLHETVGLGGVFIMLAPSIALMLLREHVRRICFAQLRAGNVLLIDCAVAILQISGMLLLAFTGTLTAARAFVVIAVASAPTVAVWMIVNRDSIRFRRRRVAVDFARNWRFARWLLAAAVVVGGIALLEPWALSLMHGTFAAGVFAAALSIVSLMNPLMLGFRNFFGPQAAHILAEAGVAGLQRVVIRSTLLVFGFAGTVMLAVLVWSEDLLLFLYGDRFQGHGMVVTALVLPTMVELVGLPTGSALVALSRGDIVLKAHLVQLALTLTVGLWCIHQFGPAGVGYGSSFSYSGAVLMSGFAAFSLFRDATSGDDVTVAEPPLPVSASNAS